MMQVINSVWKIQCDNDWERGLFEGQLMTVEYVREEDSSLKFIGKVMLHGSEWDVEYPADQVIQASKRELALLESIQVQLCENSILRLLGEKLYKCLSELEAEVKSCDHSMRIQDFRTAKQLISDMSIVVGNEADYEEYVEITKKIHRLWGMVEELLGKMKEREVVYLKQ